MPESRRKWLLVILAILAVVLALRVGPIVHDLLGARKAAAQARERRFQPSNRVAALLNRNDVTPPTLDGQFPCVSAVVSGTEVNPEAGNCSIPATHSGPVDRFEADLRYGHFVLRQTDLYLDDVFNVPLTRTYNSGDYIHPNRVHAFGKNTNHPYDIAPLGSRFPYTYNMIALEDGDFLFFPRVSEGTNYSDAIFQHTETSTRFYKAVTAWNEGGWTTWLPDGTTILFPEAYNSTNMAQGAPIEIRDAPGNRLELLRDKQGNLQELVTPHQHSIKFFYDEQSRIVRAQDDSNNWTEYRYNDNGMLSDVASSSGHRRHYSYEGLLMITIEDQSGAVLLQNSYQYGRLTRQDFGNGKVFSYAYTPASGVYAETVNVTLPTGTQIEVETGNSVPAFLKKPPN